MPGKSASIENPSDIAGTSSLRAFLKRLAMRLDERPVASNEKPGADHDLFVLDDVACIRVRNASRD